MTRPILATRLLSKRYRRRWVVRDLNLVVHPGDIFGFLGPNGAGKSTTIRMLLGLVRPTRGTVTLLGCEVQRVRERALTHVGAVVEAPAFYDHLSGWKNLELFARMSGGASPARIAQVLAFVGLSGREHEAVSVYSHGMRQRLGIAQSLLPNPQLVILDEPTDGLDPSGVVAMRQLIQRLRDELGLTVFLSTHMLHEVEQLCNRVGILHEGRLLFQGEVHELTAAPVPLWEVVVDSVELARRVLANADCEASLDGGDNVLLFHARAEQVAKLNEALVRAGVSVSRIAPRRRTLEQAYFELTAGVVDV